jgi:hypothetical protein
VGTLVQRRSTRDDIIEKKEPFSGNFCGIAGAKGVSDI